MARQEVTVFFQKVRLPDPKFETTQIGGEFHCKLSWKGAESSKGALAAQEFTGVATNKKKAAAGAAELGLAYLQQQAIYRSTQEPPPPELLWDAIRRLMTKEVLRREPEFEGQLLLTQHHGQGWIPLHLLAQTRPITQWAANHLPQVPPTSRDFLPQLRRRLEEESLSHAGCGVPDTSNDAVLPEMELHPEGHSVRRVAAYTGRKSISKDKPFDIVTPFLESLKMGQGMSYACVLIPADDRASVEEVHSRGEGNYWDSLASLLGVSGAEVAAHARGGKSIPEVYLPKDDIPDDMGDDQLLAMLESHLGELPNKRQKTAETGAENTAKTPGAETTGLPFREGSAKLGLTEIRHPTFYATTTSEALNLRATWLLGRPLYGPVLLSHCRLRPSEWRTPIMKWASFSLPMFRG